MDRLIKYSLIIIGLHTAMRTIIALFFYDQLPIAFLAGNFNQAFFFTMIYFIFRYFSGKNPTSPLWPIYVIAVSLVITQIIGFITFLPLTQITIQFFIITLFIGFIARQGHNKRKNEII